MVPNLLETLIAAGLLHLRSVTRQLPVDYSSMGLTPEEKMTDAEYAAVLQEENADADKS